MCRVTCIFSLCEKLQNTLLYIIITHGEYGSYSMNIPRLYLNIHKIYKYKTPTYWWDAGDRIVTHPSFSTSPLFWTWTFLPPYNTPIPSPFFTAPAAAAAATAAAPLDDTAKWHQVGFSPMTSRTWRHASSVVDVGSHQWRNWEGRRLRRQWRNHRCSWRCCRSWGGEGAVPWEGMVVGWGGVVEVFSGGRGNHGQKKRWSPS